MQFTVVFNYLTYFIVKSTLKKCFQQNTTFNINNHNEQVPLICTHLCIRGSHIPTGRISSKHPLWEDAAGLGLFRSN
jgi:hypothetical protein